MKNFWHNLALSILKYRLYYLSAVIALAIFMTVMAAKTQVSSELPKILPQSDERFQLYESFKKRFGEDGSVMVIGVETNKMFQLAFFQQWQDLAKAIKTVKGIKDVVYAGNIPRVEKNDSLKRFITKSLIAQRATSQVEVDAVKAKLDKLPFYKGFIINETGNVHLMMITFDQSAINDKSRVEAVQKIKKIAGEFETSQNTELHLSGMPFIRTEMTAQITNELGIFLILAIVVTSLILLAFFRSFKIMLVALVVVLIGIVSALGIIVMFGFKISIISGLIPPLVVVIGVPNAIFIVNKYYEEYALHGNQELALKVTIEKIGQTLVLSNLTTAIGFGVFAFTGSIFLIEFGIVAAINVMLTYAVSLILIPVIFSFLAPPANKHTIRLESGKISKFLLGIDHWVNHRRSVIYLVIILIIGVSVYGTTKIKSIGYIVDDLTKDNPIYTDLKFIEKNFKGIMPFEVAIDTYEPGRVMNSPELLTKIKRMEKEFAKYPEFTKPVSLVTAAKFIYQGYRGGDPKYFVLPGINELAKLKEYNASLSGKQNFAKGFIDSTKRYTRVSFQIADCGTVRTNQIIRELQPKIDSIFNYNAETNEFYKKGDKKGYDAEITGNSVIYAWQNDYLQGNLVESTLQAIFLICIIMALLFRSWKMVFISTLPSLIPLLITAGLMGYFDIHLKYSTILIFSIAFGISSDGTIYFLTRYKDELLNKNRTVKQAVTATILNTGVSMFYTAIVLFTGFFIFTASTFKGTQSLGILISITLLMAMICNLILLPAFLMTLNKRESKKLFM
ncbi:MMPL family transporter [Arcicella aquatica]|uniref:MMPL family transporter n=1 Tax=Arcicella aquatica TaxID=217141 RepID=A0ABU5QLC2_9BACT|nr:MMPL family transporter [Arcicella aquatica]MEA5257590.1 MMPL family transporter [Arcicella aquatica]